MGTIINMDNMNKGVGAMEMIILNNLTMIINHSMTNFTKGMAKSVVIMTGSGMIMQMSLTTIN